jgi:phosphoglucosamine mutase
MARPDGRNINAGCGSLHLEGLQRRVVEAGAKLGVAFDGDADRALFVCETGKVVNGDGILLAAARFLKTQNKLKGNRVVATSMSNLGLERVLAREKHCAGTRTSAIATSSRCCAAQRSRRRTIRPHHFPDDSPAGDGLLTAVKIASLFPCTVRSNLSSKASDYPQLIVNVKVRSKP